MQIHQSSPVGSVLPVCSGTFPSERPFYSFIFLSESFRVCLDAGTTERLRSSSPNKVLTNLLSAIIFSYLCEVG